MTPLPPDTQKVLKTLQQVAATTLDRQRRLGHYAVIWRDGKAIAIDEDAPSHLQVSQDSESIE
jgi:ABC-type uncharacterized transport system substrate-binding protein